MAAIAFKCIYFDADGTPLGDREVVTGDYWEACKAAWDCIPAGAEDFRLTERLAGPRGKKGGELLGFRLNHSQKATSVARATADRKLVASLS